MMMKLTWSSTLDQLLRVSTDCCLSQAYRITTNFIYRTRQETQTEESLHSHLDLPSAESHYCSALPDWCVGLQSLERSSTIADFLRYRHWIGYFPVMSKAGWWCSSSCNSGSSSSSTVQEVLGHWCSKFGLFWICAIIYYLQYNIYYMKKRVLMFCILISWTKLQ